ncbi:MAG: hypothetical protein ACRC7O_04450, partial [Fimbriiglobus sp.]
PPRPPEDKQLDGVAKTLRRTGGGPTLPGTDQSPSAVARRAKMEESDKRSDAGLKAAGIDRDGNRVDKDGLRKGGFRRNLLAVMMKLEKKFTRPADRKAAKDAAAGKTGKPALPGKPKKADGEPLMKTISDAIEPFLYQYMNTGRIGV